MAHDVLSLRAVYYARQQIAPVCVRTPLRHAQVLSERVGVDVFLKHELLQPMGSYKVRGAAWRMLNLSADQKSRGVVTYSTGNHGLAVAYVAERLGLRAVICVSEKVQPHYLDKIRKLGAEIVIYGKDQDHAGEQAYRLQDDQGLVMVHPFDDPYVIAGQGTIGLELLEDYPYLESVIVPLAGGGLISGIARVMKAAHPGIRVVGVSGERTPSMVASLRAGKPIEIEQKETLARSLEGGIGLDNRYTFPLVSQLVDEAILVSEDQILEALVFMFQEERLIVEGAAAVGVAALLYHRLTHTGDKVGIILSGGNVDDALLEMVARRSFKRRRRGSNPNALG